MTRFSVRAIALDLDGTLLDTVPDLAAAARDMALDVGVPPRSVAEVRDFVGKGIPSLVRRCLGEAAADEVFAARAEQTFRRHYAIHNGVLSRHYPGVMQAMDAFRRAGFALACVTNKAAAFTLPLLSATGLAEYFAVVVSGDTVSSKKPHPEPLLHACAQLGVAAAETVLIGDSDNDRLCARAAGARFFGVPYGYNEGRVLDAAECDALLSRLDEAPALLAPIV